MTHKKSADPSGPGTSAVPAPTLNIRKLGIVSRDYNHEFPNGYRDFSYPVLDILGLLDDRGCDAVLFSLYSIVPRDGYHPLATLRTKNVRAILYEQFKDGGGLSRGAIQYVVAHQTKSGWQKYTFQQFFGTVTPEVRAAMPTFVQDQLPRRVIGNSCVLLCGETNGVKYSPKDKKVHDPYRLRASIPSSAGIILNPIHDRMTRFEMALKRQFLSRGGRWVVSVWNKGKKDKNGKTKDGIRAPWTVFHDGKPVVVDRIPNDLNVEIGVLEIPGA